MLVEIFNEWKRLDDDGNKDIFNLILGMQDSKKSLLEIVLIHIKKCKRIEVIQFPEEFIKLLCLLKMYWKFYIIETEREGVEHAPGRYGKS